jgi:hypothetical protein
VRRNPLGRLPLAGEEPCGVQVSAIASLEWLCVVERGAYERVLEAQRPFGREDRCAPQFVGGRYRLVFVEAGESCTVAQLASVSEDGHGIAQRTGGLAQSGHASGDPPRD